MAEEKVYNYLSYGKGKDGMVFADTIGFVTTSNIRSAKDGDVRSFGLPLENVQGKVAAMFPNDFEKNDVPDTIWVNVAMFNNGSFKIADRFSKAIDGKERVRLRVSGVMKVTEYEGKKRLEMAANDFHILWAPNYKGTNVGGGKDGYSYVSGIPGDNENSGIMAVQGYVNRPDLREVDGNKKVLGFGLALNKASRKINYTVGGSTFSGDDIWVDVAIFDKDNFHRAEQAAKVLRTGAAIAGIGLATVEEYEGKKRLKLALNDFDILKFAKDQEGQSGQTSNSNVQDETPFDTTVEVDIDDDDLPF